MSLDDETRIVGSGPQETGSAPPPKAVLVVVHSPDESSKGTRFALGAEDATLGRDEGNTIVIAGRVYDLGNSNASTNGISGAVVVGQDVNGAPMSPAGVSTTDGSYTFAVHPPRNSDGSPSGSVTLRV